MVVAHGMPFVSPHSALFSKQFQRQSCSPLISLGGVHLFILCAPQLFLSLEVVLCIEVAKKKMGKMLPKGGGSCSKRQDSTGKAGGQAGRRPGQLRTQEAQWTSVPTACILTPCAVALRWERRRPLGIPFYSREELAPGHGTWRAWVADASLKPKSGPGKEGQTEDWEAAVHSPPGNAGAKLGGRNWGCSHCELCPKGGGS